MAKVCDTTAESIDELTCCVARGTCGSHTCPTNKIKKTTLPNQCAGSACTDTECCDNKGSCATFTCPAATKIKISLAATTYCATQTCDAASDSTDESTCCEPRGDCAAADL